MLSELRDYCSGSSVGLLLLLGVGLLGGCSSTGDKDKAPKLSRIADANKPRIEPKSRRGNPKSYVVFGKRYYPKASSKGHVERGLASWYGKKFHGRKTSNGERYNMYAMTAAHKTLPLPTYARVTNLTNGCSTVVRINDRGPFHGNRIIDLSYSAARKLGMAAKGVAMVEVRAIGPGRPKSKRQRSSRAFAKNTCEAKTRVRKVAVSTTGRKSMVTGRPLLYLQVGAFGNRVNAERLRRRLANHITERIRICTPEDNKMPWYKVQIGPFTSRTRAHDLSQQLAGLGLNRSYIVVE